ncbi:MAG: GAF domain-containing protein, partial [Gallionella sp.]|nr:GAF domain-containing protein [Gallionella sp.]
ANQAAIAIKNARLFDAFVNEQQHTALLYHLSLELSTNLKSENVANRALQAAADALGVTRGNILTLEDDDEHLQILAVTGYDRETIEALNQRLNWTISQGVTGRVVRTRMATTIPDVSQDADWIPISGLDDWVRSILSVPLVAGNRVIGALNLLSEQLGFFKTKSLSLITAIASPVALALQNARLYEGLRQRFKELEILADTSSALRKAQSYNDIPPILLAKAVEGLKADAGVLLLLEKNALIFSAIHGETNVKTGDTCPQDAGMMWQALESGKPIFIPDVTQIEDLHKSAVCQALMGDALSCVCIPLRTNTSAIGVVYLNWKKKTFLSADESRLLESLAEIAANAIHRSTLHLQTVQQAQDITLAYDATIEGWSRALDLRDRETEGHSQRVTNLTLQLAQALGVNESELEHIRRGALLHDIGKMGVPDNILRKAGALSEEEWALMHRHPQLAHEMLFPIAYLQPALDIPYCHHEKWDGSGYPRGLKGEEIPLAARIFAVVDVFDALTSDRPYRPAWTKRKATAHIRQQSGIH